jgi:hypothetical protein
VVRVFGGQPYDGVVDSVRVTTKYGTLWRVYYAEDDDTEDLAWRELRDALQPPAQPAARADVTPAAPLLAEQEQAATPRGAAGARRYKGVCARQAIDQFQAFFHTAGGVEDLGYFDSPEAAARAYDDAVRAQGRRVVNFPRPGTDEVQAVPKLSDEQVLRRQKTAPSRSTPTGAEASLARARSSARAVDAGADAPAPAMRAAAAAAVRVDAPVLFAGCRVSVPFEAHGGTQLFHGTVLPRRSGGGKFTVRFDDGDVRNDFTAAELEKHVIRGATTRGGAARRRAAAVPRRV